MILADQGCTSYRKSVKVKMVLVSNLRQLFVETRIN